MKLIPVVKNNELICFRFSNRLIYKLTTEEHYRTINIEELSMLNPNKFKNLVPVIRDYILTDWNFSIYTTSFLLASKDTKAIEMLKRYSNSEFTKEELMKNSDSAPHSDLQSHFERLYPR